MRGLIIVGVILAILLAVFVLQNNVAVAVSFLFWRFESTLALVLLLSLAVGVITVVLVTIPANWRRRGTLSRQRKELTELAKQAGGAEAENCRSGGKPGRKRRRAAHVTRTNKDVAPAAQLDQSLLLERIDDELG